MKRVLLALSVNIFLVSLNAQFFPIPISDVNLPNSQFYLNPFESEISDSRGEALGRTSILSSQGSNFLFNNPAMLSKLTSMNFQIGGRMLLGSSEVVDAEDEYYYSDYDSYSDHSETKTETDYTMHLKLNGMSFGMPITLPGNENLKLGIGAGYQVYYDHGYNAEPKLSFESSGEGKQLETETIDLEVESHGGLSVMVFGAGLSYQDRFFLGASFSTDLMSETENKTSFDFAPYPGYSYSYDSNSSSEVEGSFFTLSGSYIISDNLTVGARFRSGITLKDDFKGKEIIKVIYPEYEYDYADTSEYEFEYEISIPSEIGLAIEFKPQENLKIYAEYLTKGFGDFKFEVDEYDYSEDVYEDSENGYSFRTGIEYGDTYILRGGFFIQSVPVYEVDDFYYDEYDEETIFTYKEDPLTEIGFTGGLGFNLASNITVDVFGSYSMFDYDYKVSDTYEDEYSYSEIKESRDFESSHYKVGCTIGWGMSSPE